jgi:hypothetical protein
MTQIERDALSPKLMRVLEALPRGYDHAITLADLAERSGCSKSVVRDRIQSLREQEIAPIGGGQQFEGYWIIDDSDELAMFVEAQEDAAARKLQTRDNVAAAFAGPSVVYEDRQAVTDGGTEIPTDLRQAVDVLVDAYGVSGAESELQERFKNAEDPDRVSAALSYLRRQHEEVNA